MSVSYSWAVLAGVGGALVGYVVVALGVMRLANRWSTSLRSQVLTLVTLAGVGVVVVAGALAWLAVIDGRGVIAVSTVLSVAVPLALVVGWVSTAPLGRDLRRLERGIASLGGGGGGRLHLARRDELGTAGAAVGVLHDELVSAHEERGVLMSSIVHDLRAPLTVMRVVVEGVRDEVIGQDEGVEMLEEQIATMTALVDDLFLVGKANAGQLEIEPEDVDLPTLLHAVAASCQLHAPAGVTVTVDAPSELATCADLVAVRRMVTNLVTNAFRYAPQHTSITIRAGGEDGVVRVEVGDEGPGFPPGFASSAFAAFTRGDPSRVRDGANAGLGLAVVAALARAHGGSVWVGDGPGGKVGFSLGGGSTSDGPASDESTASGDRDGRL